MKFEPFYVNRMFVTVVEISHHGTQSKLSFFLISLRSILILSCTFTLSFRNRFFSLQFFRLNFVKFFISFTFLIRVSLISSLMWYIHNIWWLPVFVPQLPNRMASAVNPPSSQQNQYSLHVEMNGKCRNLISLPRTLTVRTQWRWLAHGNKPCNLF